MSCLPPATPEQRRVKVAERLAWCRQIHADSAAGRPVDQVVKEIAVRYPGRGNSVKNIRKLYDCWRVNEDETVLDPYFPARREAPGKRPLDELGLSKKIIDAILEIAGKTRVQMAAELGCKAGKLGRVCRGERDGRDAKFILELSSWLQKTLRARADELQRQTLRLKH